LTGPAGTAVAGTLGVTDNVVTFTPTGGLALMTPYVLDATTGIRDLAGHTFAAAAQSRFTTRDGTWGSATNIGAAGDVPQLGFDGQGNVLVVWEQSQTAPCRLGSTLYTPGVGWSSGTTVPSGASGGNFCIVENVVANRDGSFVLVWYQNDN